MVQRSPRWALLLVLAVAGCGSQSATPSPLPASPALVSVAPPAGSVSAPPASAAAAATPTAAPTQAPSASPSAQALVPSMDAMTAVFRGIRQFGGARGSLGAQTATCYANTTWQQGSKEAVYTCDASPSSNGDKDRFSSVEVRVYADPASAKADFDQLAALSKDRRKWSVLTAPRLGDAASLMRNAAPMAGSGWCSEYASILAANVRVDVSFLNLGRASGGRCGSWGSPGSYVAATFAAISATWANP